MAYGEFGYGEGGYGGDLTRPRTAQKIKLTAWSKTAMSESPYTGSQQVYQWLGEGWKLEVAYPPMKMADAEPIISALIALRGRSVPFLFGDTSRKTPQGVATGTPMTTTAGGAATGNFAAANTAALSLAISIGDCVVIFANGTGAGSLTISDNGSSGGNTYTRLGSEFSYAGKGDCWICLSATKIATTVTIAGTGMVNLSLCGGTFHGVTAIGASHTSNGTSGTASDSVTTTAPYSLVVSGLQVVGDTSLSVTSGTQKAVSTLGSAYVLETIITQAVPVSGTAAVTSATFTSAQWQQWSVELQGAIPNNPARSTSIVSDGWTPSVVGILKAGDYVQLQAAGAPQRLYKVLMDADSDSSGNAVFYIFPRLREDVPDGTAIVTSTARGTFRLATDQTEWDIDSAKVYGISFSAIEAI